EFIALICPLGAAVGEIELDVFPSDGGPEISTVYNVEPSPGRVAALGFRVGTLFSMIIALRVATRPPHNLIVHMDNVSQAAALLGTKLTVRGIAGGLPLLTLPRSCGTARAVFEADSWQSQSAWVSAEPEAQPVVAGCGSVGFAPA